MFRCRSQLVVVALAALCRSVFGQSLPAPWLPSDPGAPVCEVANDLAALSNGALRFAVRVEGGGLHPAAFDNRFTLQAHALAGELFSVTLRGRPRRVAGQFTLLGAVRCEPMAANPGAVRPAERRAGVTLSANLADPQTGLRAQWRATLRTAGNYIRESLTLDSAADLDIERLALIEFDLPGAWVNGIVSGSPIIADDRFFGFEHPMAEPRVLGVHATMTLKRALPLRAGVPLQYSAVLGVASVEQLRRGFAAYVESERATEFRTFLHYNSWYDIGYFTPYTEQEALKVIVQYGEQLVRRRGVRMDSFLFDDGWDDTSKLWQFSKDFPRGFGPLRDAAAKIGTAPGMWLSPWGGYGPPRKSRLATARSAGLEVDDQGLALSGAKYYPLFHDVTLKLLREGGVNMFKLDGTGSPDKVTPGSAFDSDFAAAIALIDDLRAVRPDLFINLTTGTWPSPFWLRTADAIWRGGEDHSFAGVGSNRQRWITYRDADIYGGIVRQGPLFPLNSLMLHGVIYARKAQGLETDPGNDFADEVHSYFATGTGLQEMYVSPDLLTDANWDSLAHAARWARERAAVLRDSHWLGGDPMRGEVYGWGAWSPDRAVITLRNPTDHAVSYLLDITAALELPVAAARRWIASVFYSSHNESAQPQQWRAGRPAKITLAAFEVRIWDLTPSAH
jgi:hypothetical protein